MIFKSIFRKPFIRLNYKSEQEFTNELKKIITMI